MGNPINVNEIIDGTDPSNPCEYNLASQTEPTSTIWNALDCDNDGLTNAEETTGIDDPLTVLIPNGITNPLDFCDPINLTDTDGDGVSDCQEIIDATDLNNNCDFILSNINVTPTVYCNVNSITGQVTLDLDENGCDAQDIAFNTVRVDAVSASQSFSTFTDVNGDYELFTDEGDYTISLNLNLDLFEVNPILHTANFVGANNTFTADFCVEQIAIQDVRVYTYFTSAPRPGFNRTLKIVYRNDSDIPISGSINLVYDNTKLNLLSASETYIEPTTNSIHFDYTNLNPLETRIIDINYIVTGNIGNVLSFTTTINPIIDDANPDNNIYQYNRTIIGSYDPNDIHILEGPRILIENANKFLHYLIRFQNTGTADAINVMVANELEPNLDWSTFQLENLSHAGRVAIFNENQIEFIFEDIHLPDSTTNEEASHGYIMYKIKPKTNIVIGDIINNQVDIFFDFNPAIVTNIATTEFIKVLGINDNQLSNAITLYPNPTNGLLHIDAKNVQIVNLKVYSKLGQLILSKTATDIKQLNLENLSKGLYFIKLKDKNGNIAIKKIIKE